MIEFSVTNLVKAFTIGDNILDGLTFHINQGERVGLLGKNGSGKSTLFKILTGELDYDEGEISIAPGHRMGLISQIPVYPEGCTVEAVLETAFQRVRRIEKEMKELEEQMAAGNASRTVMERYDKLSTDFELAGGYDTAVQVNKICNGLGIPDAMRQQPFASLSGGEQTRVNLGRLILEDTDILLLDEPTNHLDLHAVEWLESYLKGFPGTVLTISHDRYFLDQVVTRVIEINRGKAEFYAGNYSFYAVEKEKRYREQLKQYEKEQAKIAQLSAVATVMHQRGTEKMHKTAFAMEKRIERLRSTERPMAKERALKMQFSSWEFNGDELFTVEDVSKSFGGRTLFDHVSLEAHGGERIALLGDNGTGKSTLIKILMGEESPDEGKLRLGPTVKIGYLPQIIHFDHPDWNLVENMMAAKRGISAQSARNRLAAYDFRGEDVLKPVSVLSGGEQSRLRLCMLMDDEINFLILDEPTNHLDIASREWIEEAVEAYDGTLLFVSHDRYFINRFATRIWEVANGTITDYPMGFAQYRQVKAQEEAEKTEAPKPVKEKTVTEKPVRGDRAQQAARRQLTICEREIANAEERIGALDAEMAANACDYEKLNALVADKDAAQAELDALYLRWEELSEAAGEA